MTLSPDDVADLLKVLDSTSYDELHLATDRFVLRLRREPGGWTEEHELVGPAPVALGHGTSDGLDAPVERDEGGDGAGIEHAGMHAVVAPLPGVFYRAPKPGEAPFVEVGDRVEADTVVAILETMKLMNPVRAGAPGRVAEIAVANNESADQGAVLMWLAPDPPG